MPTEYEAKVLDVDPAALTSRIEERGGRRTGGGLMRRYVYDIVPGDRTRWVRLRESGGRATLTVKVIEHDGIDGTHEVETDVGDFEATHELLALMGVRHKSYQENWRTSFELAAARLEIDEWPLIPPYLEIEADSRTDVVRVAGLLGVGEDELTGENTIKVYGRYGIDLLAHPELRFGASAAQT